MLLKSRPAAMLVTAALSLAPTPAIVAQETRSDTLFTVEKYLDYEQVADPQISPDGTQIVYTADGEPSGQQIFVRWMDAEGATSQVTRVTDPIGDVKWAPDGK